MIAELERVLDEAGLRSGGAFWPVSGGPALEERVRRLTALAGPLLRLREWASRHARAGAMAEVLAQTEQAFAGLEAEILEAEAQGQDVRGAAEFRAARAAFMAR